MMNKKIQSVTTILLAWAISGCAHPKAQTKSSPLVPPGEYSSNAIECRHGVVVSISRTASDVGVSIMKQGGNAVDAAVADGCDLLYRPDIMVACGPFTAEALDLPYLTDPCVIVEVFSPVTEDIDRREKLLNYRRISSVEEYVLVAQRSVEVIIFRRGDNWNPTVLTAPDDVFEARSVEVSISLEEIYEGTR